MIEKIETEHLILRKAEEKDLEQIWHNIWEDESIAKMMLWKPTHTYEEAKDRLRKTIEYQKNTHAYFVCLKDTDEPIGFAGVKEEGEGIFEESGICIARKFQGLDYGKEVVKTLLDLTFRKLGGKKFIYSCFRENEKSAKLCKSLGFQYTHSVDEVRGWDGYHYTSDYYELNH